MLLNKIYIEELRKVIQGNITLDKIGDALNMNWKRTLVKNDVAINEFRDFGKEAVLARSFNNAEICKWLKTSSNKITKRLYSFIKKNSS